MVLLSVLLDRKWIKQLATTQLHKVQPIGKTIKTFNILQLYIHERFCIAISKIAANFTLCGLIGQPHRQNSAGLHKSSKCIFLSFALFYPFPWNFAGVLKCPDVVILLCMSFCLFWIFRTFLSFVCLFVFSILFCLFL